MVTFDEHGGTYDHVPPPAAPPPDPAAPAGQMGFGFDRSGVRVPAIAISAWIPERTVVNDEYRNTSVIRTLRERWSLGAPLTARDAAARDLSPVFTLDTPRDPENWPEVRPRPVPVVHPARRAHEARLRALPRHIVFGLLALGKTLGVDTPEIDKDADISGGEGLEIASDLFGHLFPRLQLSAGRPSAADPSTSEKPS